MSDLIPTSFIGTLGWFLSSGVFLSKIQTLSRYYFIPKGDLEVVIIDPSILITIHYTIQFRYFFFCKIQTPHFHALFQCFGGNETRAMIT